MANKGQNEVKKQKQTMESQLEKVTVDIERSDELDDEQMKGEDDTYNQKMLHRQVEIPIWKGESSETVGNERQTSDRHVDGGRARLVLHSTVERMPGREKRERSANPRYKDYLWCLNRGKKEGGGGGESEV